jgi:hypothetical protein
MSSLEFQSHQFDVNLKKGKPNIGQLSPTFYNSFMRDHTLEWELEQAIDPLKALLVKVEKMPEDM